MPAARHYWLVKTEPECFSIDDLAACPGKTTHWDGVRNFQARNTLRDQMKRGDQVLFYYSGEGAKSVAGVVEVVREGYPDHTAWDKGSQHYDEKASAENPIWQMVDLKFIEKFAEPIPLARLRDEPALGKMELLRKGSRLSVQPVRDAEFAAVLKLAKSPGKSPAKKTAGSAKSAKSGAAPKKKTKPAAKRKK